MRHPIFWLIISSLALGLSGCGTAPERADSETHPAFSYERSTLSGVPDLSSRFKSGITVDEHPDPGAQGLIWHRIRNLYALPDYDRPEVQAELEWYVNHPEHLDRVMERAERYLHFIVQEAEQRGVPGEITLLPVIESAFQPGANSSAAAAGLWQFIPSTGREYGLKQTAWCDDRRDVRASTHAAMSYLIKSQQEFDGDWLLSLASYNAGPGAVRRAMDANAARGEPTDFWSLKNLPRETRNYVPRLLAVAQIVRDPARYNISLRPIADAPYFAVVELDRHIDLQRAASLADVSVEEMRSLNPEHKRKITDPEGPHDLLVPRHKAHLFQERLAQLPKRDWFSWSRYRVRRGEGLDSIAARFDTDPAMLREINQLSNDRLTAGRVILVPATGQPILDEAPTTRLAEAEDPTPSSMGSYTVRRGETLYSVARKHRMEARVLAALNRLKVNTRVRVGQKLRIQAAAAPLLAATEQDLVAAPQTIRKQPTAASQQTALKTASSKKASAPKPQLAKATPRIKHYKVKAGDSLSEISQRFDVSMDSLRRWNKILHRSGQVQKGQTLVVYRSPD